ncbi:MAG: ABC transporter ATP-binding protein [Thaumarchaeota archaeon]|nr:ABC transporter ATP-binding protein [Nitrososphaerota archaeon]
MPKVEVADVYKNFGGVQALKGVSFTLGESAVLGLIGPNGSGKSTLLNIIAGLQKPTSGAIRLDGKSIGGLRADRVVGLGVAKTSQIPKPFVNMDVRENVAVAALYGRRFRSVGPALEEADRTLTLVRMQEKKDAPADSLTTQEKKRLELAKSIATGAKVLLLDEVFAGLSAEELRDSVELFRKLHSELRFSALVVEHVMRAVLNVSENVVVLEEGQVIASGSPEQIVHDEKVVQAYLGSKRVDT